MILYNHHIIPLDALSLSARSLVLIEATSQNFSVCPLIFSLLLRTRQAGFFLILLHQHLLLCFTNATHCAVIIKKFQRRQFEICDDGDGGCVAVKRAWALLLP